MTLFLLNFIEIFNLSKTLKISKLKVHNYVTQVGLMVKYTASIAEGHGFDSGAGQIGHRLATAAMFLQSVVAHSRSRGDSLRQALLRRNSAGIMKIYHFFITINIPSVACCPSSCPTSQSRFLANFAQFVLFPLTVAANRT